MWIALLLFVLSSCSPLLENPFEGEAVVQADLRQPPLKIIVLDVGQGDAQLVIGPEGRTMLIDGGPPDTGPPEIFAEMEIEAVDRLDWIVATHYDSDHIGGLPEILEEFPSPFGLIDRGDSLENSLAYGAYLDEADNRRETAFPGEVFPLGGGVTATVVVVNGRYSDGRSIHLNPDEENESSIGLLIAYGKFKYFTAGDLTGGGAPGGYETKDLESWAGEIVGDIDVLHVGHHGSATSTNDNFLELTRPEAALISVGKDNDYGHPSETVLRRLEKSAVAVSRTDQQGTIRLISDGESYEVDYISTKTTQLQSRSEPGDKAVVLP